MFDRDTPGRARLKYYFDISDTHEGRFHRPVPLWQVYAEQEPEIVEALEHRFGALPRKETLGDAIVSAMENAVTDNMADYLADLQQSRDGSFLEELDVCWKTAQPICCYAAAVWNRMRILNRRISPRCSTSTRRRP